jgi:hypothetical protein
MVSTKPKISALSHGTWQGQILNQIIFDTVEESKISSTFSIPYMSSCVGGAFQGATAWKEVKANQSN